MLFLDALLVNAKIYCMKSMWISFECEVSWKINQFFFFLKSLSGLNFADIAQRQGLYPSPRKPPFIPGLECSGTIEELGEGVTGLEVSFLLQNVVNCLLS